MTPTPSPSRPQPQHGDADRRNPPSRLFLRVFLGFSGAALVLFPIASGNGYVFSVLGLAMFIVAILLPPAQRRTSLEEKTSELGAAVVVDGGRYRLPHSSSSVPVQLFVAADRISVLDARFHPVLQIPTAEITSFLALEEGNRWFLEVIWSTHGAEFSYRGASAARLAHAAENAIRKVAPAPSPIPQRRAATA